MAFLDVRRGWARQTAALAVASLSLLLGCGDKEKGQTPPPAQSADPWRHRAGAGTFVEPGTLIVNQPAAGTFTLAASGKAPPLVVSSQDYPGVVRVVGDLRDDINRVTGITPAVATDTVPAGASEVVLVGTIGLSPLITSLVNAGKLDVRDVQGRWETFVIQAVDAPMAGVTRALVVAGSDQRGTIYGAYEISRRIGVSPWYYFDDVPAVHRDALYVNPGRYTLGTPAVKYRGVFINDENPQLGTWVPKIFGNGLAPGYTGGFNSKFYAKIFETLLRLRANYLWPAVWGRAFALDDPQNHAVAKQYGIVMGTSHEAPMARAIDEWTRLSSTYGGTSEWRFSKNRDAVVAYMKDGIERMKDQGFEEVVTMGMRGEGDIALSPEDGVPVVRDILDTQRQILADVLGPDIRDLPKVWTLYHEVQDWYLLPGGITPPEDITVVWADDNWGYFRKLPNQYADSERYGGYGFYYHFDFVGGPRCYKWVDSNLLANAWEQLNLAYTYGVDRLWMVNVGDFKDLEFPMEFFLDYAWAPERWPVDRIPEWQKQWAVQQFGAEQGPAIAQILDRYQKLQFVRKPELLNLLNTVDPTSKSATASDDDPFSLVNYAEHQRLANAWEALAADADQIGKALPASFQDAYWELVLYKVKATANLYKLRLAQFTAQLYSAQGRAATSDKIALATACQDQHKQLNATYNTTIAGGKWNGWATQPILGYSKSTYQEPEINGMADTTDPIVPAIATAPSLVSGASMGVAIDGSTASWSQTATPHPALPSFSPFQTQSAQYIDVFNKGQTAFTYTASASQAFVTLTPASASVSKEVRIQVAINWSAAPAGLTTVPITITGAGATVIVDAVVDNRPIQVGGSAVSLGSLKDAASGFVEANGYVSMEAEHYTGSSGANGIAWFRLPNAGRTGSAMTVTPRNAPVQTPGGSSPHLEYQMYLVSNPGQVKVWTYLSARNSVRIASGDQDGLLYAVSIDDEAPQIVNASAYYTIDPQGGGWFGTAGWNWMVAEGYIPVPTQHTLSGNNPHVLRYWLVDPTAVVQKLVVDTGGLKTSSLGPPESCIAPGPCKQQ